MLSVFLVNIRGKFAGVANAFSSWSFENVKHMSSGEGGMLLTNNEEMAILARKVAGHGYKNLNASGGSIKFNNEFTVQDPGYKRHDKFGINYRLSEFCAAIALGQLEDLEKKVQKRIEVANLFLNEMIDCELFVPQHVPPNCDHSYYTLGVLYEGAEKIGVSWQQFRDKYVELGGDSFYAAWSVPYFEPVVANGEYKSRCPEIYSTLSYESGLCPVAEEIQPKDYAI